MIKYDTRTQLACKVCTEIFGVRIKRDKSVVLLCAHQSLRSQTTSRSHESCSFRMVVQVCMMRLIISRRSRLAAGAFYFSDFLLVFLCGSPLARGTGSRTVFSARVYTRQSSSRSSSRGGHFIPVYVGVSRAHTGPLFSSPKQKWRCSHGRGW